MPHPHHGSAGSSALHGPQPRTRVDGVLSTLSWQRKVHRLFTLSPRCDGCNICSHVFWWKQVTWPCLSSQDGEMQSCHVPAKKRETNTANTLVTFSPWWRRGPLLVCAEISHHMFVREVVPNMCPLCFPDFSLLPFWPCLLSSPGSVWLSPSTKGILLKKLLFLF